ncbi:MAG: hypothetical protein ACRDLZ_05880 [Gaiellaceae bacterium]
MRRIVTWCLLGAVAGLGLVAGIDALRDGGEPEQTAAADSERQTTTEPAEQPEDMLAEARVDLEAAGVPEGRLTYADEDCRNHVLTTPDLRSQSPPPGYEGLCRYRAVVGTLVGTAASSRSPGGDVRGAAWKPDGTVTFLRDGDVRRFIRCPGDRAGEPVRCSRPVLTRAELAGQLRGAPWDRFVLSVKEIHWLDNQRFAALIRARSRDGSSDYLGVFDRGRLIEEPLFAYAELGGIRPSPSGRLVAAYDEERGGIVVVNRAGESVQLAMDHGSGISWSPDEEWIAEATEDGIYVFRADDDFPEFIHIPIVARDLLWE